MKPYLLLLLLPLLSACYKNRSPDTEYYPVLISRASLEQSVAFHAPDTIVTPAKILYKDNFILISERDKGVHVIDNTDPKNPVNKGYIKLVANTDVSLKGNVLYADNAVDLIAIDLSTLGNSTIKVLKREKDIFPELSPPDNNPLPDKFAPANRPANTIIIAWEK